MVYFANYNFLLYSYLPVSMNGILPVIIDMLRVLEYRTVQEGNGNRQRDPQRKTTNNELVDSYKITYHLADEEDDTHECPYGTRGWA